MCVVENNDGWRPVENAVGKQILPNPYPLVGMWLVSGVGIVSHVTAIRHELPRLMRPMVPSIYAHSSQFRALNVAKWMELP